MDVRSIRGAAVSFCYHVYRGRLLCSRDEALRTRVVGQTVSRYLDIRPLQRQALKEAIASWA